MEQVPPGNQSSSSVPRPVFVVAGTRSSSLRYVAKTEHDTLAALLGATVASLGADLLDRVETIFVSYRYPAPPSREYSQASFLEAAGFKNPARLRIRTSYPAILGGLDVIDDVLQTLRYSRKSTVLVVGGEAHETAVTPPKGEPTPQRDSQPPSIDIPPLPNLEMRRKVLTADSGLSDRDREVGLTPLSANALVADAMFRIQGFRPDEINRLMCQITTHLERYAHANPNAYQHHRQGKRFRLITQELYQRAIAGEGLGPRNQGRKKKWPFHLFDCCAISNGAAALLFSTDPDVVEQTIGPRIRLVASAVSTQSGGQSLLDRPPNEVRANAEIWRQLEGEVPGLDFHHPPPVESSQKIILELFDSFTYQVALTLLEMGMFSSLRDILAAFEAGYFDPLLPASPERCSDIGGTKGSEHCGLILNPSGGSKDGHPTGAYGLVKMVESFKLLTGRELDDYSLLRHLPTDCLRWAVVHCMSVANTAAAVVMERET